MTYTVIGRCARSGELGVAIATYSVVVGGLCPQLRSNVGAISSQAFVNPEFRPLAIHLLSAGYSAAQTLDQLIAGDPHQDYRQVGIVDRAGRTAVYTGKAARPYAGHREGEGYAVFGNVLASEGVVDAMAQAMETSTAEPLAERLLRSLEAGRDAGGQRGAKGHLPERSASLLVHGLGEVADMDLRADMHPHAVEELRRIHDAYLPYIAFNRQRWLNPASAPPQEVFVAGLAATAE